MRAYLQTSESGWEEELEVRELEDGTVLIPVSPGGTLWVRVVQEDEA